MGFPPRSWFGHRTMGMHAFPVLYQGLRMADPTYFDDFWSQPGYLGHDPPPSLDRDGGVGHACEVVGHPHRPTRPTSSTSPSDAHAGAGPGRRRHRLAGVRRGGARPIAVAVELTRAASRPRDPRRRAGGALGRRRGCACSSSPSCSATSPCSGPPIPMSPGSCVRATPSRSTTAGSSPPRPTTATRCPRRDFTVWDQFRDPDGNPDVPAAAPPARAPVRRGRLGHGADRPLRREDDRGGVAARPRGPARGRPTGTARRSSEHLGDATDDHFRLWFTDNALHGDDEVQEHPTHSVSYLGAPAPGAARPERRGSSETSPRPRPRATQVVDGQVVVGRGGRSAGAGVQPVVALTVDGGERADVAVGAEVVLRAERRGARRRRAGRGRRVGPRRHRRLRSARSGRRPARGSPSSGTHSFAAPGTHFVTVRVAAQRDGDTTTRYARVQNLARVRVVVD